MHHPYPSCQNEKGFNIVSIRSDYVGEFQNEYFEKFCEENGIHQNFLSQEHLNKMVLWKGKIDRARTLLNEIKLPKYFWVDAMSTICYTLKRVLIIPILKKTPCELYKGRKPNISHLRVFGCKCFVLNNGKEYLNKFDAKDDEAIFLGYSLQSKAYRCLIGELCVWKNLYMLCVMKLTLLFKKFLWKMKI